MLISFADSRAITTYTIIQETSRMRMRACVHCKYLWCADCKAAAFANKAINI